MTTDEVRELLLEVCEEAGTQQAWAKAHRISPQYVTDVLKERREPGGKMLAALGLRRVVAYERIQSDAPLSEVVAELRSVTARYGGLSKEGCGE